MTTPRLRFAHLLEFALYWPFSRLLRLLPHDWALVLGAAVGRAGYYVLPRRRRMASDNMRRILADRSVQERRGLVRACFAHWGEAFIESVSVARFSAQELERRFEVEGLGHLKDAMNDGKGIIVISGHFGSFEAAISRIEPYLGAVHILVRHQSNPLIARDASRIRQRTGHVLVSKKNAGPRLLKQLKRGGAIGLAIDQRVAPHSGILLPFLGFPAWTSPVPAYLSTVTGAPTVPMLVFRMRRGHHRIVFDPPIRPSGRGPDEVAQLTNRYLEGLQAAILESPDRWLWMHRRWQRTDRHTWPSYILRVRNESNLPPRDPHGRREQQGLTNRLLTALSHESIERGDWLVVHGGEETLRDSVVATAAHRLIDRGYEVALWKATELGAELARAGDENRLEDELQRLDRIDLLILRGLENLTSGSREGLSVRQLLERRYKQRGVLLPLGRLVDLQETGLLRTGEFPLESRRLLSLGD